MTFPYHADHAGTTDHQKTGRWEGSPEGKAYAERNHQSAGLLLVAMGLGDLRAAWGSVAGRATGVLPAGLLTSGLFLMIWSDHDAWPIGGMSFVETFSGSDPEVLQHKLFGIASLIIGVIELGLRFGLKIDRSCAFLLPTFAVLAGTLLLAHDHGHHPNASHIARHHALLGTLAMAAGFAKGLAVSSRLLSPAGSRGSIRYGRWGAAGARTWAGLLIVLGLLLALYRE